MKCVTPTPQTFDSNTHSVEYTRFDIITQNCKYFNSVLVAKELSLNHSWNLSSVNMIKSKTSKTSVSDKINELFAPKESHDPEYNSDDETNAKTRVYESEDEQPADAAVLSHIRKKNVRMLQDVDAKYRGKLSSRNEFDDDAYENSSESEADGNFSMRLKRFSSDDEIASDLQDSAVAEDEEGNEDGNEDQVYNEDEDDENESDFDGGDIMPDKVNESDQADVEEDVEQDVEEKQSHTNKDIQKGTSIQSQLVIWEKLLEIRIHSQKLLLKANSLPQADHFQQLTSHHEFDQMVQQTSTNVANLLSKMCTLQKALVNQYPEMKTISEKRKRTDYSDDTDRISKFSKKLENDFIDYKAYRNATISKWYDRTKVLAPGKASKQPTFDILRNIEGAMSNRDELIKKSQLYKGGYEIIGAKTAAATEQSNGNSDDKPNGEFEPLHYSEIYDDTDFYHTQLRELIEVKANTSNNPIEMTKQFVELQKLRNKIKKVVDTRASKGRKIRYAVHNKMVNFMARNNPTEWTDEAKTELFSSLFGGGMG